MSNPGAVHRYHIDGSSASGCEVLMFEWNAIILAGGRATRLGGIDKCSIIVRGRSMLESALAATESAKTRVVISPERPGLPATVRRILENPPHGGIPSAVEFGLANLADSPAEFVAIVAADQPRADEALPLLLTEVQPELAFDAWVAADPSGRQHPLLAVYRYEALARAIVQEMIERGEPGRKLHAILPRLRVRSVSLFGHLCADIDTPTDLAEQGIDPDAVVPSAAR